MKILITGSKGFIGTYLFNYLDLRKKYELTELPVRLEDDIGPYFEGQDFVIHLAAKKQKYTSEEIYQVNVKGTEKVAQLCLKYRCKLINISSKAVYNSESEYGRSKLKAEKIIENLVKQGLKAISIRPTTIYNERIISWFRNGEWYSMKKLAKDIENLIDDSFEYRTIDLETNHNKYKFIKRPIFRVLRKIEKICLINL